MYTIGKVDIGSVRTDANGSCNIYWDASTVAYVHTHGQYVVDANNQFSQQDKDTARLAPFGSMMFAYVGVPSGVVRKYDPWSCSDVIIFNNAPR